MKYKLSSLWFNSSIALLLAGMVATTLHELSHLTTGKIIGESATLFPNEVVFGAHVSTNHQILTAATGPIFSLISGLIIITLLSKSGKGFMRLFWMWLGLISAQIGFGYLIIAPFARNGDTGKVLSLLNAPNVVYIASFILGIIGMLWLARTFAKSVVAYTDGTTKTMRPFGIYSWLTGTILMVAVYMFAARNLSDSDQIIVLIGVATSTIFAPMFSFFYRKITIMHEKLALDVPYIGVAASVVVALILELVLANGVHF